MLALGRFRFVVFALFTAAALSGVSVAPVVAQPVPGQEPGVVAVGFGSASAPADAATLQFLLGSSQAFGMGGDVVIDEGAFVDEVPAGEGTPGPETMPSDVMGGMGGPPSVTEDQLDPIVAALVAAGAAEAGISVAVPAATEMFGPGGPEVGEVLVAIAQPQGEQLRDVVRAVHDAATRAGLTVLHVGASYEPADCAALLQEARDGAIADARTRAEGLARGLGVTLGELVQVSETPYFGPVGGPDCAPEGTDAFYGPYGPGTAATFNPATTEATATIQVVLTFAMGPATAPTVTPTPDVPTVAPMPVTPMPITPMPVATTT